MAKRKVAEGPDIEIYISKSTRGAKKGQQSLRFFTVDKSSNMLFSFRQSALAVMMAPSSAQ